MEAGRQLHNLYGPKTKGRAMALLTALMGFPVFTKDKIFLEQLPLSYSSVGTAGPAPSSTYVDAQGCPLDVATTRIATLQFGDVAFKEKFIIADVTTPLVALGHIIRSGWSLVQSELGPCLVKGDHSIQVLYKNNSLRARGSISKVSQVDPVMLCCSAWYSSQKSHCRMEQNQSTHVCNSNNNPEVC